MKQSIINRRDFMKTAGSAVFGTNIITGLRKTELPEPLLLAQRVADHYIATQKPSLDYRTQLTFYGIIRLAKLTGRGDYDEFVDKWLHRHNKEGPPRPLNFEHYTMGNIPGAYRYVQGRNNDLALLRRYVDNLINKHPRDKDGVFCLLKKGREKEIYKIWVDCLMVVCPFLSMAGVVLNDVSLHDESIAQYIGMENALFDHDLGLFHQNRFSARGGVISNDTWGRGNGWAMMALVEIIRYLPKSHPKRDAMIARLQRLIEALIPLQADSGMWHNNLITPESYEETSCTGLILYAFAMGLRKGWLTGISRLVTYRAWLGLSEQVDINGAVYNTCVGTGGRIDATLEYYLTRPRFTDDSHSFGPVLLAAVEMHKCG
jgi:unsaturated rhamnogalacturonyl hydrolase